MANKEFAGKNVLITGGARGLGRATAVKLAQHGANVAVNYVSRDEDAEETKAMVEREGAKCILVKADVSEPSAVEEMVAQGYGRIVCLSSVAALRPRKMQIHYAASKAALHAVIRCCAEGFAPTVRINGIAPGLIDTELGPPILGPEKTKEIVAATPLARLGQPVDIANAVYFLLSDLSDFMTGQTIVVSGGRVMLP